eukprot:CAMPEP_0115858400 /NCGR_PEP_ID=MMETSP0287-20121206/16077_1 /TAXON_ID=412157 /ORGANISM="Chrysochromulina rotalis, Strain UIO044" /LENGTH=171 /DNA_ID=CAMNT_0003312661 /DNA_START=74 /DNA_END=589 /DNA_ORIENTATION=-
MEAKAWQPRSPEAMFEFLRGRWQLTKAMDYTPGGGVGGDFVGVATFEPLQCTDGRSRLAYLEDGMATLGGGQSVAATKRLLWDFSAMPIQVSFDESLDRDPAAILEGSRFFHTIELPDESGVDPTPFVHWCDPDTYRGTFLFQTDSSFVIKWQVEGPKKLGNIVGSYVRTS